MPTTLNTVAVGELLPLPLLLLLLLPLLVEPAPPVTSCNRMREWARTACGCNTGGPCSAPVALAVSLPPVPLAVSLPPVAEPEEPAVLDPVSPPVEEPVVPAVPLDPVLPPVVAL